MPDTISPEDRVAVMNLIADYAFRLDSSDLDGYVDNFAPDGVFDSTNGRFEGREAIGTLVAGILETGRAGKHSQLRHVMGLPRIEAKGDRLYAETYVIIPATTNDGQIRVRMSGTYTDVIVKVDGRWRFAVRHIRMALTSNPAG